MEYLTLSKGDFKAKLYLEEFFPASVEKTNQVFKLIFSSEDWNSSKTEELLNYFIERKVRAENDLASNSEDLEKILTSGEKIRRKTPEYSQFMFCRDSLKEEIIKNQKEAAYFGKVYALLKKLGDGRHDV